jgi:hypothetical protein
MTLYGILLLIHVLMFVFWVGTDVGVFVLTCHARNPRLTLDQRLICLKVSLQLDHCPRLCAVLIVAIGAQLAYLVQWLPLTLGQVQAIWAFDLGWLAIVIAGLALSGRPVAKTLRNIERVIQFIVAIALLFYAWRAWADVPQAVPTWLLLKLVAYAVITVIAFALDWVAAPMVVAFNDLVEAGPSSALQKRLDRALTPVLALVLLIYAVAIGAAYLGLAKLPA